MDVNNAEITPECSGAQPAGPLNALHFRALSVRMRQGLLHFKLLPEADWLAYLLVLETFDCGKVYGIVDFRLWAELLGKRDSKGLRPDQVRRTFVYLQSAGIVDWNQGQGTYELRPEFTIWSNALPLRRKRRPEEEKDSQFSLIAERPLYEALSCLSREKAVLADAITRRGRDIEAEGGAARHEGGCSSGTGAAGPGRGTPDWPTFWETARAALNSANPEEAMESFLQTAFPMASGKSADSRGDRPIAEINALPSGKSAASADSSFRSAGTEVFVSSGKSAEIDTTPPAKALASSALRSTRAKLAKAALSGKAAEDLLANSARVRGAWSWVQGIDVNRDLVNAVFHDQWLELCARDPDYVLNRLRGAFEDHMKRAEKGELKRIGVPLAWLASKARQEGALRKGFAVE